MRRLLRHLTYANVMVTVLAIGALTGGVAYASNTIGSDDIIDESIQSHDIKNGQVRTSDIGNGQIRVGDIGAGAISGKTYQKQASTATDGTDTKELSVTCDGDDRVTGGGFVVADIGGNADPELSVARSYAVDPHSWLVRASASNNQVSDWQVTVIADCVS